MKKYILIILLFVLVVFGLLSYSSITGNIAVGDDSKDMFFVLKKFTYPTNVSITDSSDELSLGISIDTDNLNFGMIPTGGSYGTRYIDITNEENLPMRLFFSSSGNISDMIVFKTNNFILEPGETRKIEIRLQTTNETEIGDYIGSIEILTKLPKNTLFTPLL